METTVVVETTVEVTIEEEDTKSYFLYYCFKTISIEMVFLLLTILDSYRLKTYFCRFDNFTNGFCLFA
jgi:hypothetical protein